MSILTLRFILYCRRLRLMRAKTVGNTPKSQGDWDPSKVYLYNIRFSIRIRYEHVEPERFFNMRFFSCRIWNYSMHAQRLVFSHLIRGPWFSLSVRPSVICYIRTISNIADCQVELSNFILCFLDIKWITLSLRLL